MYKTKYLNKKLQFIGTIFYSKWRLQVAGTNKYSVPKTSNQTKI